MGRSSHFTSLKKLREPLFRAREAPFERRQRHLEGRRQLGQLEPFEMTQHHHGSVVGAELAECRVEIAQPRALCFIRNPEVRVLERLLVVRTEEPSPTPPAQLHAHRVDGHLPNPPVERGRDPQRRNLPQHGLEGLVDEVVVVSVCAEHRPHQPVHFTLEAVKELADGFALPVDNPLQQQGDDGGVFPADGLQMRAGGSHAGHRCSSRFPRLNNPQAHFDFTVNTTTPASRPFTFSSPTRVPSNLPAQSIVVQSGLVVGADVAGLTFDVKTFTVAGTVTLNGVAPSGTGLSGNCAASPRGYVDLVDSGNGYSFSLPIACMGDPAPFTGLVYPGTYKVSIHGNPAYSNLPTPEYVAVDRLKVP